MGIEDDRRVMEVGRCEGRVSGALSARVVCVQQRRCPLLQLLAAGDRCQCEETQSLACALGLIVVRQC